MTDSTTEVPAVPVESAVRLAQLGLRIFPLPARSKVAKLTGWPDLATTDEATIRSWWDAQPHANRAWEPDANAAVLDVDMKDGHDGVGTLLKKYNLRVEDLLHRTWSAKTPSGGYHLGFRVPEGVRVPNSVGTTSGLRLGDGLDVKTDGGYVAVAPSVVDGDYPGANEWITPPGSVPLAMWPAELPLQAPDEADA